MEYLAGLAFLYYIARQICELSMQKHPKNHKGETHLESMRKPSKLLCILEEKLGLGKDKVLDKNRTHVNCEIGAVEN